MLKTHNACFATFSAENKNCEYMESIVTEEGLDEAFCRFHNVQCKVMSYTCKDFIEERHPYEP